MLYEHGTVFSLSDKPRVLVSRAALSRTRVPNEEEDEEKRGKRDTAACMKAFVFGSDLVKWPLRPTYTRRNDSRRRRCRLSGPLHRGARDRFCPLGDPHAYLPPTT